MLCEDRGGTYRIRKLRPPSAFMSGQDSFQTPPNECQTAQSLLSRRRWDQSPKHFNILMIWAAEFHAWLHELIQFVSSQRHSATQMWDDGKRTCERVFLGQCNFSVTHLLPRTSRVITCTNCSVLRRATAILGKPLESRNAKMSSECNSPV